MKNRIAVAALAGGLALSLSPASAQPICPAYLLSTELASACTPVAVLPFVRNNDRHFRHRDHDRDHHDRVHEPDRHQDQTRIRIRPPRSGKK